jgi:DNA repair photolyase
VSNVNFIQSQSVLARLDRPDPLTGVDATMNPYFGCVCGCLYCPFVVRNRVGIKTNFLPLLEKQLKSEKKQLHLGLGTACEPYCGEELEFRLSRHAVELAMKRAMPVQIFTKSDIILEDAGMLKEYSEEGLLAVTVAIFSSNEKLANIFEPNVLEPEGRFNLVKKLRKLGIFTGVSLAPIIPFVSDGKQHLEELFKRFAKTGVDYVLPSAFSMHDAKLGKRMEEVFSKYFSGNIIGFNSVYYKSLLPDAAYSTWLEEYLEDL